MAREPLVSVRLLSLFASLLSSTTQMSSPKPTILLRDEVKPGERRTCLPPFAVKELLAAGYKVTVERSTTRCFYDKEYEELGIEMVPTGSWKISPKSTVVVGLKELPEDVTELKNEHIFFAHCYKNQGGWQEILRRFQRGDGTLLDLEFLVDDKGRRVAAFGRPAGSVGAALGLLQWALQQEDKSLGVLEPWETEEKMVEYVRGVLARLGKSPRVLVFGALGRCGQGSVNILQRCGIPAEQLAQWDLAETSKGGPFAETLAYDVVINDIYLSGKIPPFITHELLQQPHKLSVVVDVSCDTSNPFNPLPIYSDGTTLANPVQHIHQPANGNPRLDVIAIDHLPTLLPRESSVGFAKDLLPHLLQLNNTAVWTRARDLFHSKLALLPPPPVKTLAHGHSHSHEHEHEHHHHHHEHVHANGNGHANGHTHHHHNGNGHSHHTHEKTSH